MNVHRHVMLGGVFKLPRKGFFLLGSIFLAFMIVQADFSHGCESPSVCLPCLSGLHHRFDFITPVFLDGARIEAYHGSELFGEAPDEVEHCAAFGAVNVRLQHYPDSGGDRPLNVAKGPVAACGIFPSEILVGYVTVCVYEKHDIKFIKNSGLCVNFLMILKNSSKDFLIVSENRNNLRKKQKYFFRTLATCLFYEYIAG